MRAILLFLFVLFVPFCGLADDTYKNPIIGLRVVHVVCKDAAKGGDEKETGAFEIKSTYVYLRVSVVGDTICAFSYSVDGRRFHELGDIFKAEPGMWIGAKVGLFSIGSGHGYADYDWFRFGPRITRMNKND
jgi:hypothetical protein